MNKNILNNYNLKEKKLLNKHIDTRGYKIKVYPAQLEDNNASEIEGVDWVSPTFGEIVVSNEFIERKIILLNTEFNFQETNISMLLDTNNNNFNNFFGYISGETLSKGSVIEFLDFNIKLTIQRVERNRPLSDIQRYIFSR